MCKYEKLISGSESGCFSPWSKLQC